MTGALPAKFRRDDTSNLYMLDGSTPYYGNALFRVDGDQYDTP